MASIPKIQVYNKKAKKSKDPTMAGRVAIIGAFDSEVTGVKYYDTLDEAEAQLGTYDSTKPAFLGNKMLPILFGDKLPLRGITGLIAYNVTTWDTSGTTPVATTTIDATVLTAALAALEKERFDILVIANVFSGASTSGDTLITQVDTWAKSRYLNKLPVGTIYAVSQSSASAYTTTAGLVSDSCYGLIPNQTYKVDTTSYDHVQTMAYWTALVAGSRCDATLTQKTLPEVTGLTPEYTFASGTSDIGKGLVADGYMVAQCYDRENEEYVLVNAEQPNGYDLYINRVRDEILRAFNLHEFLGNKNKVTVSEVLSECARLKQLYCKDLEFLEDIQYHVEPVTSKKINVWLDSLTFQDTITDIDVFVTVEVI